MQKILILFCSPNKNSHTASLLKLYLDNYSKNLHDEVSVDTISIFDKKILPCIGCLRCITNNECPYNEEDDVKFIFDEIKKTDHLIIATPLYFNGYPSLVKALIDRAQQEFVKKRNDKVFNKKLIKGSLVATCGSKDKESFECLKKTTKLFFDCMDVRLVGKLFAMGTDDIYNIKIFD